MATLFPGALDAPVNPVGTDPLVTPDHAGQHTNENDAIKALEAKVGVDNSAVTSSLDYMMKQTGLPSNVLHNGDLTVWQRGAGPWTFGSKTYGPDRWMLYRAAGTAGCTASRVAGAPGSQYGLRVQRDSGGTSSAAVVVSQQVETVEALKYAGRTVTASFKAQAGANYSAAASALGVEIVWGTGVDQDQYNTGFTGQTAISNSVTLTSTWQTFSTTFAIPSTATEFFLRFISTPTGTAGAADYFDVADVALIDSPTLTRPHRRTYQQELAACQRFFTMAPSGDFVWIGQAYAAAACAIYYTLPVTMRVAPTLTIPAGPYTGWLSETGVASRTPTSLAAGSNSVRVAGMSATGVTTLPAYAPVAANASFAPIPISADL
jgi:hypothetical protein